MNTSPPPPESQRSSISLSRLATIFAVTFAIAFGLCSVSAMAVVGDHQKIGAGLIWTSVSIEAICFVGLVVVGLIAILRR
jgi:hypothetical protein